jgi:WD40 repeat protein
MPGIAAQAIGTTDRPLWTVGDCVTDIDWSPDATGLVIADASGNLTLIRIPEGNFTWSVMAHDAGALQAKWCPTGEVVASAGEDGNVKLWNPETGVLVNTLTVNRQWVDRIAWSPDGKLLAAVAGNTLVVWQRDGEELMRFDGHPSTVTAIAWQQNSKQIATACYRGVSVFHVDRPGRPVKTLSCLGSLIALAWSPDGKAIAAGSQDRMLQFWRLGGNKTGHAEMKGYPEKVSNVAWNADGRYLASAGGNTAVIWKNQGKGPAGTAPRVLKGHRQRVTHLRYQHAGPLLATGDQAGDVFLWRMADEQPLESWPVGAAVTAIAWAPDDRTLVVANRLGEIHAFEVSA